MDFLTPHLLTAGVGLVLGLRHAFEPDHLAAVSTLATREQRLVLPWCTACERPHWYPRGFCPVCLSEDIDWRDASGEAVVHAVSVQPKTPHPGLRDRTPYAVAIVELPEGVRMMVAVAIFAIVFGSIVGYSSFVYAMEHLPVSVVSTYTYVNPVVAVFLGWVFYREPFGWRELLAMIVVFAGVAVVKYFAHPRRS